MAKVGKHDRTWVVRTDQGEQYVFNDEPEKGDILEDGAQVVRVVREIVPGEDPEPTEDDAAEPATEV